MKYMLFLAFNLLALVFSPISSWIFSNQAIDLTPGETNTINYNIYSTNDYKLFKYITKETGRITVRNELQFGGYTRDVQFESVESSYTNQINCQYILCPNGKFHVKKYDNNNEINIIPGKH